MVAAAQPGQEDRIQLSNVYRLSLDQFHKMIEAGILFADDRVELLEGLLLQKNPTRPSDGIDSMFLDELYALSVPQYHEMTRLDILTNDDRVELLEGVLFSKMTKKDPHIESTRRCRRAIEPLLPEGRFYETEQPVVLTTGEPEPDGVVIIGSAFDCRLMRPRPADIELLIEVSESSLSVDRTVKLRSYAGNSIPCYWIVNLIDRQIEVYTQPDSQLPVPAYGDLQIFNSGQTVPLVIAGIEVSRLAVDELLPAAIQP